MERLRREGPPGSFDPDSTAAQLRVVLDRSLLRIISRTLVLELHLARLDGRLRGDTPAARFDYFVEGLDDRHRALELLNTYPVLAGQVALCIDHWTEASLTFLSRLAADWQAIARRLNASQNPGALVSVEAGLAIGTAEATP